MGSVHQKEIYSVTEQRSKEKSSGKSPGPLCQAVKKTKKKKGDTSRKGGGCCEERGVVGGEERCTYDQGPESKDKMSNNHKHIGQTEYMTEKKSGVRNNFRGPALPAVLCAQKGVAYSVRQIFYGSGEY